MYLVSTEQMREIDRLTIDGGLVPGPELMERAGRGIFELIAKRCRGPLADRSIVIVCGKGNNGGDGLVLARHLIEHGAHPKIFIQAGDLSLTPDAKTALHRLISLHPELCKFSEAGAQAAFLDAIRAADLVVDALLGTGVSAPLREPALSIVRALNENARRVLSVDVPSGLSGNLETSERECVRAYATATVGLPKLGLFYYPACEAAGIVETVDIGYPQALVEDMDLKRRLVSRIQARAFLPRFAPDSHKYRRGTLLCVAGSRAYGGAALLTVGAALRSAAGMVRAALPASLVPLVQARHPAAIAVALPEDAGGGLAPEALPLLEREAAQAQALAVGPGLGRAEGTLSLLRRWLPSIAAPVLLDADALFAYQGDYEALAAQPGPRVLTPHSGELAGLLGRPVAQIEDRREALLSESARPAVILLHKGAPSEVLAPDGGLYTIAGGHPAMARGGTGDVLTGLLGGILAQRPQAALEATLLGAWVHAEAGRRAALAKGRGLNSADIIEFIPAVWRLLEAAEAEPEPWL